MKRKWKEIIRGIAPVVGGALGGPLGASAASVVSQALLGKPDAAEEEIAQYLEAGKLTPDQIVELRKAEMEWTAKLKEAQIDLEKVTRQVEAEEKQSARLLAKLHGMWPQFILTLAYNVGYFTVLVYLLTGKASAEMLDNSLVAGLVGMLTTVVIETIRFWFGSSWGSKRKTELLNGSGGEHA